MKKLIQAIAILILIPAGFTILTSMSETGPATGSEIRITSGKLTVGGFKTKKKWTVATFEKAFGSADRVEDGTNKIFTWDKVGISCYESTKSHKLLEVHVFFGLDGGVDTDPLNTFSGKFWLEGKIMNSDISKDQVSSKWIDYGFDESNPDRGAYNGIYLYTNFDANDKLTYVSFGQDDGDPWK